MHRIWYGMSCGNLGNGFGDFGNLGVVHSGKKSDMVLQLQNPLFRREEDHKKDEDLCTDICFAKLQGNRPSLPIEE